MHSLLSSPARQGTVPGLAATAAAAAAFLLSDLASGVTGEILYVDGGTHTVAMGNADPLPG